MKIIIITTWYPESRKTSPIEKTYAIHNFAKEWVKKGHHVFSIVPDCNIFESVSLERMDGVNVYSSHYNLPFGFPGRNKTNRLVYFFKVLGFFLKHRIIYRIRRKGIRNALSKRTLSRFIVGKCPHPDIIAVHGSRSLSLARFLYPKGTRILFTLHQTDLMKIEDTKRNIQKYKPDIICYRSRAIREKAGQVFPEILNFPGQNIISSGIQESEIPDNSIYFRSINAKKIRVLTVARLIKRKNIHTVINTIKTHSENFCLDIIGEGKDEKELKNLAGENPGIKFLGFLPREKVLSKMVDYDIFVLVSQKETLGLVYLEAMSKGLIVIGSKNEGIDGIIRHRDNGFLVSAGDEEELTRILKEILKLNIKEVESIKRKSLDTIRCNSSESVAERYLGYLRKND